MQFMQFDQQSAVRANSSARIGSHEYVKTKITQAYTGVSQSGAKFVALNLVSETNETADEIKVYYENGQGEVLSGKSQLNAIMAFNRINALSQVQGQYKSYDFGAGGTVQKQGLVVPELVGAFVGVILSENWYVNQNGEPKHNQNLTAVYDVATGKNARQFLDNTPAIQGQIEQSIEYAKRASAESKTKAERQGGGGYQNQAPQNAPYPQQGYPQGQGGQAPQGTQYAKYPDGQPIYPPQRVADDNMPF